MLVWFIVRQIRSQRVIKTDKDRERERDTETKRKSLGVVLSSLSVFVGLALFFSLTDFSEITC